MVQFLSLEFKVITIMKKLFRILLICFLAVSGPGFPVAFRTGKGGDGKIYP